jgi:hypothetical protein
MKQSQAVRRSDTAVVRRRMVVHGGIVLSFLTACPPVFSQFIRPDDRALLTDFSYVTAVAATQSLLFAATPLALVVYDRSGLRWRETVGPLEGFPPSGVTTMVANPLDDTAWMAGLGLWHMYRSFGREWRSGSLPGRALTVVLDRDDPGGGAWFQTTLGWYRVDRGAGVAVAGTPPPVARRIAPYTADLRRVLPAFDAVVHRITRDEALRSYDITAAAQSALDNQVYVGTNGNGAFRLDAIGTVAERLPAGLLAPGASSLAASGSLICAGTDLRYVAGPGVHVPARRGITCFRDDFSEMVSHEAAPGAVVFGAEVRDLLPAGNTMWAATDAGLVRLGRGRPMRVTTGDGLPSDDVRALAAGAGGVWAGTSHGLAFIADAPDRPHGAPMPGPAVGALLLLRDTLWIGTAAGLALRPPAGRGFEHAAGQPALAAPITAVVAQHDTIAVVAGGRVLWRTDGTWRYAGNNVPNIGNVTALAASSSGLWAAGSGGIARLDAATLSWTSWNSPADIPPPVRDIMVTDRYVWLATPLGVVRLDRRALP